MKKETRRLRCTLLSGSAWSAGEDTKESAISFFGIEHRLRKEEMEEQFQQRSQQGMEICS